MSGSWLGNKDELVGVRKQSTVAQNKLLERATDLAVLEGLVQRLCLHCQRPCFKQFAGSISLIRDFRLIFRSMTKLESDLALADILSNRRHHDTEQRPSIEDMMLGEESMRFSDDGNDHKPHVKQIRKSGCAKRGGRPRKGDETVWTFQGKRVCPRAFQTLVGVGNNRWARMLKGLPDTRVGPRPHGPTGMPLTQRKGMHVHAISTFLWHLWHSAAEGLPHRLIEKSKGEEHSTRRLSWTNRKMRQAEMGATHVPDPDSDQEIDALATRAGVHTSSESDGGNGDAVAVSTALHRMLEAHDVHGSLRRWVDSLPKRWLPPGRKVWIY